MTVSEDIPFSWNVLWSSSSLVDFFAIIPPDIIVIKQIYQDKAKKGTENFHFLFRNIFVTLKVYPDNLVFSECIIPKREYLGVTFPVTTAASETEKTAETSMEKTAESQPETKTGTGKGFGGDVTVILTLTDGVITECVIGAPLSNKEGNRLGGNAVTDVVVFGKMAGENASSGK